MIIRELESVVREKLNAQKAIIILGARQTGKTTLVKSLLALNPDGLFFDADNIEVQELFANANLERLKSIIGKSSLVIIDEAQRIPAIGITLKRVIDNLPNIQLIVTGSSTLEITDLTNEPLTGRKWEYTMYPVSWSELVNFLGVIPARQQLETRMIFGMYPEIITNAGEERERLLNLSQSYLYKDILSLKLIRKSDILQKILRALALQLGNEVSYNEISQLVGADKNTVSMYIDLLEKTFVVFRLQPLSRNLRNEISSNRKIYFYDNGIRNALLNNYAPLELRNDVGALWENFLVSERMKYNHYRKNYVNTYFWRTQAQQEIDYIEESDGTFRAFEFKWSATKNPKLSEKFATAYNPSKYQVINRDNFEAFLL